MSTRPTGDQIASVYASSAERISGLVVRLGSDDLGRTVPSTPLWNVRDLLAHLVGGPADLIAGNLDGVATPTWTQAQVEARRGHSVAQLLDEWSGMREAIDGVCRSGQLPAISMDIVTHEQDINGALGAPSSLDDAALNFAVNGFGARAVKVAKDAGLELELTDGDGWSMGAPGGATFTASKFDLVRVMSGRRSGRQVAAMDWLGDPTPYLDLLSPFGPLGDTDINE
ncbi:MAG TPA: maleylpyruvate isomerase family mycothiol-dependent enzyme [Mycobacteriales bacterium]|nr:maleylpyruvate isomerase family mycothiol-dependent enzyme [Mycobacteriales bacterium]